MTYKEACQCYTSYRGTIGQVPSTLDLQERLSSPGNRDILKKPALSLELDSGGDERPRPYHGIDGPALLHGHYFSR